MIRITRIQVTSFRGLSGVDLAFDASADRPFTILLGPNEAGKSTLLDFAREVLFGEAEAHGSVVLEARGRRYRVGAAGRRARRVVDLTSGEDCPPGTAQDLLGAIDAQVFQNVFAFGLGELQSLDSLTAQGVQERIFAAGVAGAGPSARAALGTLERETQDYLMPRSTRARLNGGAHAYGELRRLVRNAQDQNGAYEAKTRELASVRAAQRRDRARQTDLAQRQRELEDLDRLWPQWVDRQQAQRQLEALERPAAGAVAALPALREQARRHAELESQRAGVDGEIAALPQPCAALLDARADLEDLNAERAAHLERQKALEQGKASVATHRAEVEALCAGLPSGWSDDDLADFQAGPLLALLEDAGVGLSRAAERHLDLQRRVEDAPREYARARAALDATPAVGELDEAAPAEQERLARAALGDAQQRLDSAQEAAAQLWTDEALISALPALRQVLDSAPLSSTTELPRLNSELQRHKEALDRLVADLGGEWTRERVERHRAEDGHAWQTDGQRHTRQIEELQRLVEEAGRTFTAREQALRESEVRLQGWADLLESAELDEQLAGLRSRQATAASARTRLQAAAPAPVGDGVQRSPAWRLWLSLALTAVLTVSVLGVHPLLAALTLACGLGLTFLQRSRPSVAAPAAPLTAELRTDLQALGLAEHADVGQVAALESGLTAQVAGVVRTRDLAGQRDEARRRQQGDQTLVGEARQAVEDLRVRRQYAEQAFTAWVQSEGLAVQRPDDLGPLLLRLGAATETAAAMRRLEQDLTRLQGEHSTFQDRAVQVLATLGRDIMPEAALKALRQAAGEAEEAQRGALRRADALEAVKAREDDVEREETWLRSVRSQLAQQHAEALRQVQTLAGQLERFEAELTEAETERKAAGETWERLLEPHRLPAVTPADLRVLIERLGRASDAAQALRREARQLSILQDQVERFAQRGQEVVARIGIPAQGDPAGQISILTDEARRAAQLAERRDDLRIRRAGLQRQCDQATEELAALLARCGAPDVATVEVWEGLQREYGELQGRVAQVERNLHLIGGQRAAQLQAELDGAQPEEWAAELARVEAEQRSLEAEQETRQGHAAELEIALRQLSDSAESARKQLHLQAQAETLRQDARAWLVRRLASELLGTTLGEYERTRGPEVLRHASDVFARVTGGRYTAVRQVDGAATFRAVTSTDDLVDVAQLSRGTQEQLYLSVRLGLARTLGQRTAQVPLLMDDILVNADPERAAAVAAALAEVAREHQVLYLTCHPASAEMLRAAADAEVITLPRLRSHVPQERRAASPMESVSALRQFLAERGGPCGISELESALAPLTQVEIRAQLRLLEDSGLVVRSGQKRGTRYALVSPSMLRPALSADS